MRIVKTENTIMKIDEVLKLFDSLMKRKNQRKLSGSYEAKAYREEAKRLKDHYFNVLRETGNNNATF